MVIFVGDRPSKRTDPEIPFKGAACEARLMEWIQYLEIDNYKLINSFGMNLSLFKFNREEQYYLRSYPNNKMESDIFIALGNNASKALKDIPHYKLPHPSGRNRQINNKKFINQKLKECKEYIRSNT